MALEADPRIPPNQKKKTLTGGYLSLFMIDPYLRVNSMYGYSQVWSVKKRDTSVLMSYYYFVGQKSLNFFVVAFKPLLLVETTKMRASVQFAGSLKYSVC